MTPRSLHSPDVYELAEWQPNDTEAFEVFVQAILSPDDGEGEESFDFMVCSPEVNCCKGRRRTVRLDR